MCCQFITLSVYQLMTLLCLFARTAHSGVMEGEGNYYPHSKTSGDVPVEAHILRDLGGSQATVFQYSLPSNLVKFKHTYYRL